MTDPSIGENRETMISSNIQPDVNQWIDHFDEKENILKRNEPKDLKEGWIYCAFTIILTSLLKIGYTCMPDVGTRIKQLSRSTAAAEEFSLVCSAFVSDARLYERAVHIYFSEARIYGKRKEFFAIEREEAIELFERIKGSVRWDEKSYRHWKMALAEATPKQQADRPLGSINFPLAAQSSELISQVEETTNALPVVVTSPPSSPMSPTAAEEVNLLSRLQHIDFKRRQRYEALSEQKKRLKLKRKELSFIRKSMKTFINANNGEHMDPDTSNLFKNKILALMDLL
jgi:hypothetical protein